jgi:cell division protein FtsW (lipid II flippase)
MTASVQVSNHPQLKKILQNRLFLFAISFGFLYCVALTLAPFARNHSWTGDLIWRCWIGFAVWTTCYILVQKFADQWLPDYDPYILPIMFLLIGFGNLTIWRLSPGLGLRQSIWLVIGSVAFLVIVRIPRLFELLSKYRYIWLVICFILVGFTLLPGLINRDTQPNLWISLGSFNLQPSEPLKLFLIVYLAAYFSERVTIRARSWQVLLPSLAIILVTILLLVMQRDLGTASLILMLYAFAIYILTRKRRILVISGLAAIAALVAGYFFIDVIKIRVEAWINPWLDPTARSYQIVQSLIAQAAGGIFGTGPGMGTPSLVPVAASDFIFSAIAEETGLLGGAGLVVLIFILFSRSIHAAQKAETPFNAILAAGLGLLLAFQSMLIIGGNIRLVPLTGVTLPLVSYGGSSLLTSMVAIAIIFRISAQSPKSLLAVSISETMRTRVLPITAMGFIAIFLMLPFWSVIQKDALLLRGDNLRRSLTDTYVKRGTILDRNDQPINSTIGEIGSYSRIYNYPDLATTLGYAQPLYGLAGIESSLDPTLRGSTGYPDAKLWWNSLLTSQTPPGLDIRLSLDLNIQKAIDKTLSGNAGAGVILNANTGEILAISSQPGFDPTHLSEQWNTLVNDPRTPLLNRAVNGQYPVGTTTVVFLYAQSLDTNLRLTDFNTVPIPYKNKQVTCVIDLPSGDHSIQHYLQYSCPQISLDVARVLGKQNLYQTYAGLGWYQQPHIPLPENNIKDPQTISNLKSAAIGQENLAVTPLQMALAAAAISSDGIRPTPKLVTSYQTPEGKWSLLAASDATKKVYSSSTSNSIQLLTQLNDLPVWGVVGRGISGTDSSVTWFVGGTTRQWTGIPIAIAIALEKDDPQQAFEIGQSILSQFIIR